MTEQTVIHNTFVIERNYAATPERVFAAFADPAKKRRWFGDHSEEQFEMDFRVGGQERYRSVIRGGPLQGTPLASEGVYLDIVSESRIVVASQMVVGGRRISAALATFELAPSDKGTRLTFTHQAAFFEGADGPEMREAGWRKLLDQLDASLTA